MGGNWISLWKGYKKDIYAKVLTGFEPNGYISLKRAYDSTFINTQP